MKTAIALAVVFAGSGVAAADDAPFTIGPTPTWVVLGGLTTGGTVALADRGALLGGELSVALLREGNHVGFYSDAYYDWGANGTYVTGGIELGHKLFGLDGGAAVRWADGGREVGLTARASIGLGVAAFYVRYAHFNSAMTDDNVLQVGLLLKLPLLTIAGN